MRDLFASRVTRQLFTIVGVHVGWFGCVLGATNGHPLVGPGIVALLMTFHATISSRTWYLVKLSAITAVLGAVLDGVLTIAGVLSFPATVNVGWPSPIWMIAMWVNLVPALDDLALLLGPGVVLPAIVGAVGGPLAYFAGANLGAVTLIPSTLIALGFIGLEWAFAMPVLLRLRLLVWSDYESR
jgi:hypothetical protein